VREIGEKYLVGLHLVALMSENGKRMKLLRIGGSNCRNLQREKQREAQKWSDLRKDSSRNERNCEVRPLEKKSVKDDRS
jgi:hypothetical protein